MVESGEEEPNLDDCPLSPGQCRVAQNDLVDRATCGTDKIITV